MNFDIDLPEVDRMTVGAIGHPGRRTFMLQAWRGPEAVALIIEKAHAVALAAGNRSMVAQLGYPTDLPAWGEEDLALDQSVTPRWRAGSLELAYDHQTDRVAIVCREVTGAQGGEAGGRVARIWMTRGQLFVLASRALAVAARGRPSCPLCGNPFDPDSQHWCPATNGHKEVGAE